MLPDIYEKLTAHMKAVGIIPAEPLELSGEICRFQIQGDRSGKRNGWAKVNLGEFTSAVFGSWKTGKTYHWFAKTPNTPEERERARKAQQEATEKAKADRRARQEQAKELANSLWAKAEPAPGDHPYLLEKQIQSHGIRESGGALLIPMYYCGEITSLQAIYPSGQKIFLKGGQVKGCYYTLQPAPENPGTVYLGEGLATLATVKEHCSDEQAIFASAFTAGNLRLVVKDMQAQYPTAEIVLCADNDTGTEGNPGLTKARQAAVLVGGRVIYPDFDGLDGTGTDFNDYVNLGGELCL